jgi:hypothetical protein
MMAYDPKLRMKPIDALQHSFFKRPNELESNTDSVITSTLIQPDAIANSSIPISLLMNNNNNIIPVVNAKIHSDNYCLESLPNNTSKCLLLLYFYSFCSD